jgi:anti-sigma regulatory factor (Ser/Thr protein kinase)
VSLGQTSIPASLDAPKTARAALVAWMPAGVDAKLLHDAQLLVTELVANSVVHAGVPDGAPINVSAGSVDAVLWFEVADAGRSRSVARRAPRPGGGMGLNLVDNVAARWGVAYDGGTTVWFELELPARAYH